MVLTQSKVKTHWIILKTKRCIVTERCSEQACIDSYVYKRLFVPPLHRACTIIFTDQMINYK
jgi:hypothetical protein